MKLATITNWAYGATVALTLASGTAMLLASSAQEHERAAVEQRYWLDQETSRLDIDILALTAQARDYVVTGSAAVRRDYQRTLRALGSVEARLARVRDVGAMPDELAALRDAIRLADALHEEQTVALTAYDAGRVDDAREILFGDEFERKVDGVQSAVIRFQDRLDLRTTTEVQAAAATARLWKFATEVTLGITALLFLCVLFFVFRQRVLRPVIRLSDVVTRLAAQDYAVEPPEIGQIDEIGDMAQAIGVFRENGLERQRLEAERALDQARRDLIGRMTQRMQGCETLLDLEEVIERFVPEITPDLAGCVYLLDPSRNALERMCSWLDPVRSRESFPPLACWALRRDMPHRPAGATIDVTCDHMTPDDGPPADTICLPLNVHRETLGLLYFEPRAGVERVELPETYLTMLAENIGLALANLHLRDRLREMAMADTLTGLANRRQLDETLTVQLAQAERLGRPISCLMVDVDHFKRFNDVHGHDAGDAVLREVGATLRSLTRESGLAFRYGGEEFMLLMPGLTAEQAAARAEEIRARIATLELSHGGKDLGAITVSIGVASAPDICPGDRLVKTADAALLRAKSLGRNRVEAAVRRGREPKPRRSAA